MSLIGVLLLAVLFLSGLVVAGFTNRRRVRLISLTMVAIVTGVAGFFLWQSHHWERGFDQIHIGDSSERVGQIMGRPTEDTGPTIGIYGSNIYAQQVDGCIEQYLYHPLFTPECWWIAFDAQGSILKTYHFVSP